MAEHFDQLHPSYCRHSVEPSPVEIAIPNGGCRQGFPAGGSENDVYFRVSCDRRQRLDSLRAA
jgi:hypothetical protein